MVNPNKIAITIMKKTITDFCNGKLSKISYCEFNGLTQ